MTRLYLYEDWVLLLATLLAAIAEALGAEPRFTTWALITGAIAKALFSIASRPRGGVF